MIYCENIVESIILSKFSKNNKIKCFDKNKIKIHFFKEKLIISSILFLIE